MRFLLLSGICCFCIAVFWFRFVVLCSLCGLGGLFYVV